jgi:hypothetical protein
MTLAGSIRGAALALLAAEPLRLNTNAALLQSVLAVAAALLATLAFNIGPYFRK